ncbi:respiratory nitrate reductase subunit gamma [Shewanella basaltis]|uniref:nitrate reductase (quinone) n=2 Tax=Shewanella TaxID=22 RepID=A0A6G9QP87_9GAMM|nr:MULTISPECIES: respiratory nitrate reductase subunit gamma [Shewanella]MCL1158359.1 respiratory nitrate reductase subunit gamma [Shewanella inventionis]QIR16410.1 respiratory nitrate reductase subunit gamma [Shewanella aestuarii]UAL41817.1 respiratory nitrate reductase subunit gamma [Shewanella inventionis]GGB52104.1 respiratory nitrate reductase subunit gamma [Shewanella inventionis]
MSYLNTLFFGIYPYIAFAIFIVGSIVRYDREQYTWKTGSSQLLESKDLKRGSRAFHIGIIAILLGHFVGLLTPAEVWHLFGIEASDKQLIAITAGGIFGLICLYGLTILIKRRLNNPRIKATSSNMDIAILMVLYVQLVLGLITIIVSLGHLDGSEMLLLMSWAQNVVTFDISEATASIADVNIIFKLHIFLGMSLFVLFPFSRLVHIASVPVQYLSRNYQVVRVKR